MKVLIDKSCILSLSLKSVPAQTSVVFDFLAVIAISIVNNL